MNYSTWHLAPSDFLVIKNKVKEAVCGKKIFKKKVYTVTQ